MAKRVVKKSASKKPQLSIGAKSKVRDALENPEANDEAILAGGAPKKTVKAKRVAKVVHLIVSVGDDDRSRSHEDFVEFVKKRLGTVDYGKPGVHASVSGGHYVIDGVVCRPEDYDKRRQNFKPGAVPPRWAGGPATSTTTVSTTVQRQMDWDLENLSSDQYDQKYRIGKYAPKVETEAEHKERMQRQRSEAKKARIAAEEAALEDLDIEDDEEMGRVADASASRAIKILKGSKKPAKKKVVTKKKPAPKKIVRVKK